MANGFFQPKPNRFLLASQLFRQAPTTNIYGALAQVLGGLTAGIGQRRQQQDIAGQQQAFQQALLGSLPAGQAQAGIPPSPPQIAGQPAPAGIAPQPTAQPQVAGGLSPQVISSLIAGGQPQLAAQMVGQERARQLAGQQQLAGQEFERQQQLQQQQFQIQKLQQTEQLREQAERSRRAFEIRLKEGLIPPAPKQDLVREASAKGVPAQAPDITAGFTPETAQKVKLESFKAGQSFLRNKDRLQTIRSQEDVVNQMNRAEALLNRGLGTGRIVGAQIPLLGAPKTIVSKPAQEFQSIVDKMTPIMRAGLPGAASDRDVAMFRGATVGLDKAESVNRNILQAARTQAQNFLDKAKFESNYFAVHKNLTGADAAWNEYIEFNPIFIPDSPTFELNPNRYPSKRWFDLINSGLTPQEILQGQAR